MMNNNLYGVSPGYGQIRYDPYGGYTPQPQMALIYVHGIDGANAYQMPPGVTKVILWDDEVDSFYIKALDDMGRPKVIAWKDFVDHVIPQAPEQPVADTSMYITKADLKQYLSQLYVGERGRIMFNGNDA